MLGIAADNIFVFCDAWRQSENIPVMHGNNYRRMAYTFRRAASAIAVTASTTSVAFLANAFSPIVPIQCFGIYASIIVLVNYLMVIMIMPSVQMIFEIYYKDKYHYCKCCEGLGSAIVNFLKNRCSCFPCFKKSDRLKEDPTPNELSVFDDG